jgi:hypothetical protein
MADYKFLDIVIHHAHRESYQWKGTRVSGDALKLLASSGK